MTTLEGKTALVTGASRGIGRATAMALAGAGARILVHYGRSAQEADNMVAAIEPKVDAPMPSQRTWESRMARRGWPNKFARSPATGWTYWCPTPASARRRRSRITRWRLSTNYSRSTSGARFSWCSNYRYVELYEDRSGSEITLGMQALQRIGKPEDIADVVAFCGVSRSTVDRSFRGSSISSHKKEAT